MGKVKLHQDVFGGKAGETVDLPADQARWAIQEGYASTDKSDRNDEAGKPAVDYQAKHDPTLAENRGDDGLEVRPELHPRPATADVVTTPEAFDPDTRTVTEVKAYLDALPEGAGKDAEVARVKAVEAKGQNRDGIAKL